MGMCVYKYRPCTGKPRCEIELSCADLRWHQDTLGAQTLNCGYIFIQELKIKTSLPPFGRLVTFTILYSFFFMPVFSFVRLLSSGCLAQLLCSGSFLLCLCLAALQWWWDAVTCCHLLLILLFINFCLCHFMSFSRHRSEQPSIVLVFIFLNHIHPLAHILTWHLTLFLRQKVSARPSARAPPHPRCARRASAGWLTTVAAVKFVLGSSTRTAAPPNLAITSRGYAAIWGLEETLREDCVEVRGDS